VEHPYGTIKRQWGFSYIITKKYIERAEADFGLTMVAYNLRRIINIIGMKELQSYLAGIFSFLLIKFTRFKLILSHPDQLIERIIKEPKITTRKIINRRLTQDIMIYESF
jgi:hypothetical protein